jgi:hypothetical protein
MTTTEQNVSDLRTALVRNAVAALPWYAVLDAAQEASVARRARTAGLSVQSLYAGQLGVQLDHVAPHLATFAPDGSFGQWLFEHWGENLGILLQAPVPFEALHKHLRQFLLVKDEAGRKYRFRFYDPRVLRAFLPVCTRNEAHQFFGPAQCFYTAARDGRAIIAYRWTTNGLATRVLEPAAAARETRR